jgi:hypothetical protein
MMKNYCYYKKQSTMLLLAALILLPCMSIAAEPIPGDGVPEGYMLIEGDIIVPSNYYENLDKQAWVENKWWPGGVIPYEFDDNVQPQWRRDSMLMAMAVWENISGVDFVLHDGEAAFVHIQASATSNNSEVGMQGGRQVINIFNWSWRFIMAHELMHCLGFWHEQSRPARDSS